MMAGQPRSRGAFVISLDFELYWGVRDKRSLREYGPDILGARKAIPRMLELFARRNLKATWAAVGFLFFEGREELMSALPGILPEYDDPALSPYGALDGLGEDENSDPYHFAPSLLRRIKETPGQEIGTHTFSHYYCLEPGQDGAAFGADLAAAAAVSERKLGVTPRSLVFPRNQFNAAYLGIAAEAGIRSFRGNQRGFLYGARNAEGRLEPRRLLRLADSYMPLAGSGAYNAGPPPADQPCNLPASRFLRPWSPRLRPLERLRLARILDGLTRAARTGGVYHLWWHPHNFGRNLEENLSFLEAVAGHFDRLRESFGFRSMTMDDLAEELVPGEAPHGG